MKTVWSFGNNHKGYLFSQENEYLKRPLHNVLVHRCRDSQKEFQEKYGVQISEEVFGEGSLHKRRLLASKDMKSWQCFRIEQLIRLEQLERLERLEQLEQLELSNLSYEQVQITTPIDETIIYLDPPYKNTAKYNKNIDHEVLHKWIVESPYKVYVSSYEWE